MRYLSVCSGIEAATVAWHSLGWEPVGFAEIEAFPSAVLNHHYPEVTNFGDMSQYKEWNFGTINLLVGGTPCQSFSVAGLRKGLADPRGNLALVYCGILDHFRPQWFVWENVPGVLSSNGGRDFGSFLGALVELRYGFAYRVLDAQYFGVAQRRRRVFVVGYLGDWRPAAAVLFEPESVRGNHAPSRETGQKVAGTIAARFGISRNNHEECVTTYSTPAIGNIKDDTVSSAITRNTGAGGETQNPAYVVQPVAFQQIADCLTASYGTNWNGNSGADNGSLFAAQPIALAENTIGRKPMNGGNGDGFTEGGPMYTLNATGVHGVAQPIPFGVAEQPDVGHCLRSGASKADKHESTTYVAQPTAAFKYTMGAKARGIGYAEEQSPTFDTKPDSIAVMAPTLTATNDPSRSPQSTEVTNQVVAVHAASMAVRRLTPVECERLQGFPDNYTNIPWRKQPESPDGPRYKALGNSMAVPVMAWIGKRIAEYEQQADRSRA